MKLGSLCSGGGGLDMAVEAVFGAEAVWHCETDPAASKVLAHRWPSVPNHGDLIATDWATVERVDIIAAGWPCQPFSSAGKRRGAEDDRAIWPHIARAVRVVRPRIIVLENVVAVLAVGEFQRVASDLAAFGYDLRWACLRASDVGAPHQRERLFVVAHHGGTRLQRAWAGGDGAQISEYVGDSRPAPSDAGGTPVGQSAGSASPQEAGPQAGDRSGHHRGERSSKDGRAVADSARDGRHERWPEPAWLVGGSDAAVSGAGPVELLPTPRKSDGDGGANPLSRAERMDDTETRLIRIGDLWGNYAPAIHRWERLTRSAPPPTEPNRNGKPRLNPAFSEWMMGWPAGWVTAVPGISRNDQLRIIGNGVVPQCAAAAFTWLLNLEVAA